MGDRPPAAELRVVGNSVPVTQARVDATAIMRLLEAE